MLVPDEVAAAPVSYEKVPENVDVPAVMPVPAKVPSPSATLLIMPENPRL